MICWTGWPTPRRCCGPSAAWPPTACSPPTQASSPCTGCAGRDPHPRPGRPPQAIDDAWDQATRQLAAVPDSEDPAGWPAWRMLLPHIEALASHASPDADTETTADLLNRAGVFLVLKGQPARAAGYLRVPSPTASESWARTTLIP